MNGVGNDETGVLILGATNIPWQLDPAIKRRFEKRIYIPLPDPDARKRMFELNVGTTPCELNQKEYRQLAEATKGCVAATPRDVAPSRAGRPDILSHRSPRHQLFGFRYRRRRARCAHAARQEGPQCNALQGGPPALSLQPQALSCCHVADVLAPSFQVRVPSKDDPSVIVTKLTPCSPGDAAAKEMSWTDVEGDQLQEPILGMKDFLRAISNVRRAERPEARSARVADARCAPLPHRPVQPSPRPTSSSTSSLRTSRVRRPIGLAPSAFSGVLTITFAFLQAPTEHDRLLVG
jgi:vacuolar protein-sorting-associated protein 4